MYKIKENFIYSRSQELLKKEIKEHLA